MNLGTEEIKKYHEVLGSNIMAIKSLVTAVRGTIGPKGLDVMLVDEFGSYNCTGDGVEILSSIRIAHPVAKLLAEAAKSQENRVGDGTTTLALLVGSMLESAAVQIKAGLSPTRLVKGIQIGIDLAVEELEKNSKPIKDVNDPKLFAIAKTAARGDETLANLLIKATRKAIDHNFDLAKCIIGAESVEAKIIDGFFLKKKAHFNHNVHLKNIKALIVEGTFEPEPLPAEAISTSEGVKKYESNVQALAEAAKKIVKAGIKAVFVDASMLPSLEEYLVKEGVFVLTMVKKSDLFTIKNIGACKIIGRQNLITSDFEQIRQFAGSFSELNFHEELHGYIINGTKHYQPTVLISAETQSLLQEKERIATDAAKATQVAFKTGYVLGSGIAELNIIENLQQYDCKEADLKYGLEVVMDSLRVIFAQIAENAGFDAENLLNKFKAHAENPYGIDFDTGALINLEEAHIIDPLSVKTSALRIAGDTVSQILRINLILNAK
jgi:chaperonin GroEL (HSP60 family)